MEVIQKAIEYYVTSDGRSPFHDWYTSLKDVKTLAVINNRLTRVERGLLGDHKALGSGVYELKIDVGPGYRIYFGQEGQKLIWLLHGGYKKTQQRDIEMAKKYWDDYLRRRQ